MNEHATRNLQGQVAWVTGAGTGIGEAAAQRLASLGATVVLTGRREAPLQAVADRIEQSGGKAWVQAGDLAKAETCARIADAIAERFGRLDILVNNAGALHWRSMLETPMKRFDLVMGVNARGAFACTRAALPHLIEGGWGHILMMSPPVTPEGCGGKVAYAISKFGMTLIAQGLADEVRQHNVACNALWPATLIESQATINHDLGGPAVWRKPDILADAAVRIFAREPAGFTGHALIDEDFLREEGVDDFTGYRCDPSSEPPRIGFNFNMTAGKV
jgi:citronellol/citronellal dehydrogenase